MSDKGSLSLIRTIFRAIRRLPEQRRLQALAVARQEIVSFREATGDRLAHALEKGRNSLAYIDMLTPARRKGQAGRFVVGRDGSLVETSSSAASATRMYVGRDDRITDEHMKRHHQLLRRQHFMEGPLKGKF